jgi:Xaa-Pro aminopeptidase
VNRLLDRKISEAGELVQKFVHHERAALLQALHELAPGNRQLELAEHAEYAARVQQHMSAYNALVALRTELGE